MPLKIHVKSTDEVLRQVRTDAAERVVAEFGSALPDRRLLCFFDDADCQVFKAFAGNGNRGFCTTINGGIPGGAKCPEYIARELLVDDGSWVRKRAFEHFIYLHGSACEDSVGFIITFAHELQHFIQTVCSPIAASASRLVFALKRETGHPSDWNDWFSFPHERDARLVAKRLAVRIIDPRDVERYIDNRIRSAEAEVELRDWQFIQGISPTETYDFPAAIREAYRYLSPFRAELVRILEGHKSDFTDIGPEDLEHLLSVDEG